MRTGIPKWYFLIPIVYASAIMSLVYMQFSERESFEEDFGAITISGVATRAGISDLRVEFQSIVFFFTQRSPLQLMKQGVEKTLEVQSYSIGYDRAEVVFDQGLKLVLAYDVDRPGTMVIRPELATTVPEPLTVSLPFSIEEGAVHTAPGIPMVGVGDSSEPCLIFVSKDSNIDLKRNRIDVTYRSGDANYGIRIEKGPLTEGNLYVHWFSRLLPAVTSEEYETQVSGYLDVAYRGWTSRRLTAGGSAWLSADARSIFDERIGAAMMSESLRRADYRKAVTILSRTVEQAQKDNPGTVLPYLTSAFLGNLRGYVERSQSEANLRREQISELVLAGDQSVFLVQDLVPFIIDRIPGPFELTDELRRIARNMDHRAAPLSVCVGMADALLSIATSIDGTQTIPEECTFVLDHRILPAISDAGNRLLLSAEEAGPADVLLTIRTGLLVMRIGDLFGRPSILNLGRRLVISALSFSDAIGFLPATVDRAVEEDLEPAGSITPETIYELIADTSFYPRRVSLYPFAAPGTWIWTAARIERIDFSDNRCEIDLRYPTNHYHYLMIQGLDPLSEVRIHDRTWKTDPTYFMYTDGWVYEQESRSLYLKLTHWSDPGTLDTETTETVTITFR